MINWSLKKFDELTPGELYAIMQLRIEVFVVEQNCPFQDADNKDQLSWHLLGWQGQLLAAYSRIMPAGVSYHECPSIGRIVTSPKVRRAGAGKMLMTQSIIVTEQLFGKGAIRIGAQLYLKKFYESFGFLQSDNGYLEDSIPHIEMTRSIPR